MSQDRFQGQIDPERIEGIPLDRARNASNKRASYGDRIARHLSRDPSGKQGRLRGGTHRSESLLELRRNWPLILGAMPYKWAVLWRARLAEAPDAVDRMSHRGRLGARMNKELHRALRSLDME